MMNLFLSSFVLCAVYCLGVQACTDSHSCGHDSCCVDGASGRILSNQQLGGFGPHFPSGGSVNGTCVRQKAKKGDMCDSNCQCGTGLRCYRPMSGVCCPPRICYDEAYVIKQQQYWQQYWQNCMKSPSCAIPP